MVTRNQTSNHVQVMGEKRTMDKALSDVRILDMTHVQAGPTSSQLMAFLGADVIKLESPMGDATRKQLRDVRTPTASTSRC